MKTKERLAKNTQIEEDSGEEHKKVDEWKDSRLEMLMSLKEKRKVHFQDNLTEEIKLPVEQPQEDSIPNVTKNTTNTELTEEEIIKYLEVINENEKPAIIDDQPTFDLEEYYKKKRSYKSEYENSIIEAPKQVEVKTTPKEIDQAQKERFIN